MARGANRRSKKPPMPPAPSQVVKMRTRETSPCGVTVNVVARLEFDVRFLDDPTWFGLGHRHPELAPAPAGGHRETHDRAGADTTRLDLEVGERRGQEPVMMLAQVGDIAVYGLGRSIYRRFGSHFNLAHRTCVPRTSDAVTARP